MKRLIEKTNLDSIGGGNRIDVVVGVIVAEGIHGWTIILRVGLRILIITLSDGSSAGLMISLGLDGGDE